MAWPTQPRGHDSFPEDMTLKARYEVWGETKGRNQESRSRQRNMSSRAKTLWSEGLNGGQGEEKKAGSQRGENGIKWWAESQRSP